MKLLNPWWEEKTLSFCGLYSIQTNNLIHSPQTLNLTGKAQGSCSWICWQIHDPGSSALDYKTWWSGFLVSYCEKGLFWGVMQKWISPSFPWLTNRVRLLSFAHYMVLGNEAMCTLPGKTAARQEVCQLPRDISAANAALTALNQQP